MGQKQPFAFSKGHAVLLGWGGVHVTLLAERREQEAACSVGDCAAAWALF